MEKRIPSHILPVIVVAQFAGTSLWFAGNAVVPDLITELGVDQSFIGFITMAVQAGFILGTLVFAALNMADRFSPVKVFLLCALAGALANVSCIWATGVSEVITARVLTGFFLAGIYPVGMKIAADWHVKGLGKALGYLVGALVLGTAFPHLLKFLGSDWPWKFVMAGTSILALLGGILLFLTVPNGPFRSTGGVFTPKVLFEAFKDKNFRSAAFGYFGHMWELYAFWAFIPVLLMAYIQLHSEVEWSISLYSFLIIGVGAVSCAIGGYFAYRFGSRKVALISLVVSGLCGLVIPFAFGGSPILFMILLFIWGIFVIPDSPQFSTLVTRSSNPAFVATGLTIVNSIGFALTIVSIQIVNSLWTSTQSPYVFWILVFGPIFGIFNISRYHEEI